MIQPLKIKKKKKKEILLLFATMWLNLEIILSGVSQELTYMWNLKKIKTTKLKKGDQITRDWGWED